MIGEKIRIMQQKSGLSVQALEKRAGLRRGAVQNILCGKSKNPTIQTMQAISHALECTVADLLNETSSEMNSIPSEETKENAAPNKSQSSSYHASNLFEDKLSIDSIYFYARCCIILYECTENEKIFLSKNDFLKLVKEASILYSSLGLDEKLQLTSGDSLLKKLILHLLHKSEKNSEPTNTQDAKTYFFFSSPMGTFKFSQREYDCLRFLAQGKTMKEIAKILSLSHRTVESYLQNAKMKTGSDTKSELITLFLSSKMEPTVKEG